MVYYSAALEGRRFLYSRLPRPLHYTVAFFQCTASENCPEPPEDVCGSEENVFTVIDSYKNRRNRALASGLRTANQID